MVLEAGQIKGLILGSTPRSFVPSLEAKSTSLLMSMLATLRNCFHKLWLKTKKSEVPLSAFYLCTLQQGNCWFITWGTLCMASSSRLLSKLLKTNRSHLTSPIRLVQLEMIPMMVSCMNMKPILHWKKPLWLLQMDSGTTMIWKKLKMMSLLTNKN